MRIVSYPIYLAILTFLVHIVVAVPVPNPPDAERHGHLMQYIGLHMEAQRHTAMSHRHAHWERVMSGPQRITHKAEKERYANLAHAAQSQAEYHHSQLNSSPSRSRQSSSGSSDGDPFQYAGYLDSARSRSPSPDRAAHAAR